MELHRVDDRISVQQTRTNDIFLYLLFTIIRFPVDCNNSVRGDPDFDDFVDTSWRTRGGSFMRFRHFHFKFLILKVGIN